MVALHVRGRVIGRSDGEVHLPVHIEKDCLDDGLPAGQEQVLRVGPATAGLHQHP